jgi:penicillin-binding protein 1C
MERIRRTIAVWLKRLLPALLALAVMKGVAWLVPLPERLAAPPSLVVRYHDQAPAFVFLSPDDKWRIAATPADVDPAYVKALLRLEDKRFAWHPGIDPIALVRAFATNLRAGRVVSGGSTITMQLVRVLEPRPRRLSSKVIEALRALQLELRYSKDEILGRYLTYVPFGRNVEGVEAAARAYFGHGAAALTGGEIATLLAVPQNPNRRYPHPDNERRLARARDGVARRLAATGTYKGDADDLERLLTQPAPSRLRAFPREAPHVAYWLAARQRAALASGVTTLDRGVQTTVERLVRAARRKAVDQGVRNVAVVVADHATGAVRAAVGGFDYWQASDGNRIVSFDVPRSPGSALKPFIYGLALDRGLILPERLVADVPISYAGYSPRNYDGQFLGLVTYEHALAQSLNIPFVSLLEKLGIERFLGTLASVGVERLAASPGAYGLSAAVGGIELTALELTALYAALAQDGAYKPLKWTVAERSGGNGVELMSAGTSFLTRRALAIRDRPDFPRRRDFTKAPPSIFWKTGTSFGHKDAWAIGSDDRYTVAVWFGNVDYGASFALVGAEIAAPLLFDILEGLRKPVILSTAKEHLRLVPEDLKPVRVCSFSGHVPGPACRHTRSILAKRDVVPTDTCPYHVEYEVDRVTGLAVLPMCRNNTMDVETRPFTVWPVHVQRYLSDRQRGLPRPPSFHPDCKLTGTAAKMAIASPRQGQVVMLIPGMRADKQEVPFEVETDTLSTELNWFVNGTFVGRQPASERFWWTPVAGEHEVRVTDDFGALATRRFKVRAY